MDSPAAFGVSAANMVERHMAYVLRRFRVDVLDGDVLLAEINRLSSGLRLTVEKGAPREKQLELVAMQIGYEALNYLQPTKARTLFSDREKDQYSRVLEWAAWVLIPDQAVVEAEQSEWDDRRLAHECGVTLRMARVRIYWWKNPRPSPAARVAEVVQLRPAPEEQPAPVFRRGRIPAVTDDPDERKRLLDRLVDNFGGTQG